MIAKTLRPSDASTQRITMAIEVALSATRNRPTAMRRRSQGMGRVLTGKGAGGKGDGRQSTPEPQGANRPLAGRAVPSVAGVQADAYSRGDINRANASGSRLPNNGC